MKNFISPKISIIPISGDVILSSSGQSCERDCITVNPSQYGWRCEPDEKILVCHDNFQLMKNAGKHIGSAFGKEHFISQSLSSQPFVCCVTTHRVVLIPTITREKVDTIINVGMKLTGVDFLSRKVAASIYLENYVNYPLEFKRADLTSALLSEDFPSFDEPIIELKVRDHLVFIQSKGGIEKAMDVSAAVHNPGIFLE